MPDRYLRAARLSVALVLAALVAPAPAHAARTGTIKGRVLNESTGEPQAGVRVTLATALDDGSDARAHEAVTDERGRYAFTDLPTGDDRFYAVDARYAGGAFAGGVVQLPEDTTRPPVIETTLRVWDTTTDPSAIVVGRDSIFLVPSGDSVGVIEALQVTNIADQAYIGRGRSLGAERDGAIPSLGFSVPAGAELAPAPIVDSDLDIPQVVEAPFGFAATTAIPPGEWRIVFSYSVTGEGGAYDLSRPVLYPTLKVGVYAADPLTIDGSRVSADGTETVEGRTYDVYMTSETLEPGDRLELIALAEASASNLLAIGAGIAGALALLVALFLFVRRRSRRAAPEPAAPPPTRQELVEAIARLDLAKEQGLLSEDEWGPRRAELKRRLEEMSIPERTP